MYILGLSFLADSGAVLLKDGVLLEAVNEERFNRKKLTQDIPRMAVDYLLEKYNLNRITDELMLIIKNLLDQEA